MLKPAIATTSRAMLNETTFLETPLVLLVGTGRIVELVWVTV